MLKRIFQVFILLLTLFGSLRLYYNKQVGNVLDEYNGVKVYFNNLPFTSKGKSETEDGYSFGEKYQSTEFVTRYYYEKYSHKMPDSSGKAKDFYDLSLKDGEKNLKRDLIQYSNPSNYPIKEGDIVIFKPVFYDPYGHVAIVSKIGDSSIEIIQQNCWKTTRKELEMEKRENMWYIKNERVLGRLQNK